MVQVIDDPYSGNVFGRIGKGISQGLSEQLPKEIERGRLSYGLKNLANSQETDPLKRLADIYSIPGIKENPEIANQVNQYIQSNQLRNASRSNFGPQNNASISSVENTPASAERQTTQNNVPKFDRNASNYLTPSDASTIDQRAAEIQDRSGILFQKAQEIAQREDDKRVASEQAFESRSNLGSTEFRNYITRATQKEGSDIYGDISGELQEEYETKVFNDIANGISPKQAAKDRSDQLLELSKTRQKISVEGAKHWYSSDRSKGKEAISAARGQYKNLGQLKLFEEDLIKKLGMSRGAASTIAYPASENKKIAEQIKVSRKNPQKAYESILNNLGENDSINSIAKSLNENGGKGQAFKEFVRKMRDDGKKELTERQNRELEDVIGYNDSLTDIWYTSIFGKRAGV